jgi:hypothetical protein
MGGGGIKTGRVIGASDKYGAVPTERPVSIADFAATVYHVLGLDPKGEYVTQGRRMRMLPEGSVIRELL